MTTLILGRGAEGVPPDLIEQCAALAATRTGMQRMGKLFTPAVAYDFRRRVRAHLDLVLSETQARVTDQSHDVVAIAGSLPEPCDEYERGGVHYWVFELAEVPVDGFVWRLARWGEGRDNYRLTVYVRGNDNSWRRRKKDLV